MRIMSIVIALALSAGQRATLEAALARRFGRQVRLAEQVDAVAGLCEETRRKREKSRSSRLRKRKRSPKRKRNRQNGKQKKLFTFAVDTLHWASPPTSRSLVSSSGGLAVSRVCRREVERYV